MGYKIIITDKANDQFNNIVNYIAAETDSVNIALDYLNKLEESISKLAEFPFMGVKPRYSILRKQRYLVLIIQRHLVFYKVDELNESIIIYAIVDGKQEYKNLI